MEQSQPELRKVTTELEHQNAASLPGLLQGKFEEERISTLKAIQQINAEDQKKDPNVPNLDFRIFTSYAGTDSLSLYVDRHTVGDYWNNGPLLYEDTLNFSTLTHSAANDAVPPNRTQTDVRALTSRLEQGQAVGIKALLSGMYIEEKLRILKEVQKLNAEDLSAGKTKVTLEITMTPNKSGDNYIYINRVRPGFHDSFFGGQQLYQDSLTLSNGAKFAQETNDDRK